MLTWARAVGTGATLTTAAQRARLQGNPASTTGNKEYASAIGHDNGWLVHDREIPGFNAQLADYPAGDITIVVLINSDIANPPTAPDPPGAGDLLRPRRRHDARTRVRGGPQSVFEPPRRRKRQT